MTGKEEHKVDLIAYHNLLSEKYVIATCKVLPAIAYARELEERVKKLEEQLAHERWRPSLKLCHTGNENIFGIMKIYVDNPSTSSNTGDEDD